MEGITANQRIVSGTIRNTGEGWYWLDDAGHAPTNVDPEIITESDHLKLKWSFIADKVHTLIVTPDETYAGRKHQIHCGSSVKLTGAHVYLYDNDRNKLDPSTLTEKWGNFWVFGMFSL